MFWMFDLVVDHFIFHCVVMIFKGKVEAGKLKINQREYMAEQIKKFEGKEVVVEIKEMKAQRSLNQNAYYWGVVIKMLMDEFGMNTKAERDSLHQILVQKFIEEDQVEVSILGKDYKTAKQRTSSDLNTKEFEQYLADVRQWANAEFGIFIPEPNENYDYLLDEY